MTTAYDVKARLKAWRKLRPIADGGKGQAFTLTHSTLGTYDPATGTTSIVNTTQTGCGIVEAYKAFQIDGTLIKAGDQRVMLAALTTAGAALTKPEPDDTILIGAKTWTIKAVEPFEPAGLAIFYYLQIRG